MKFVKRLSILVATLICLITATPSRAAGYYYLHDNLRGVMCIYGPTLADPSINTFYAYFAVSVNLHYPTGARIHSVTNVIDTTASAEWMTDTWTTAPTAVSGSFLMDRIDSPVPYYIGKKTIDLWVGERLLSETIIKANCAKEFMDGTFGQYGEIVATQIF